MLDELPGIIRHHIRSAGGWLPFDRFMSLALYEPGLGYYANALAKFGQMPGSGSDFVTAPELTPLFGHALARQVAQALATTGTDEVWEFGAGTGALALQVIEALAALGQPLRRYTIVDLSGSLRERQRATLAAHANTVQWADALPAQLDGVVLGNEVLDAMPVQLLARTDGAWHYGFPEAEYYHPQRAMGTLICHRAHRSDSDPLADVGRKDITAHVNFTGVALAAQDAGMDVIGYTSQGRFLLNCGVVELAATAGTRDNAMMQKLINEHEMGELFKVIALAPKDSGEWMPIGFANGDRTHRL